MPAPAGAYDDAFFQELARPARHSAEVIVPLLHRWLAPTSVLDVGCGTADWLAQWRDSGVAVVQGVDGPYVDPRALRIPQELFVAHDLTTPLDLGRRFDLVSSLEVAEHLDAGFAPVLVASLVRHADTVLFSAAPPGQEGTNHVNCQWPTYWAQLFSAHGYEAFDVVRPTVWDDGRVMHWYRQNMLVFARGAHVEALRRLLAEQPRPLDVAHPAFLEAVLGAQSLRRHLLEIGPLAVSAVRRRIGRAV